MVRVQRLIHIHIVTAAGEVGRIPPGLMRLKVVAVDSALLDVTDRCEKGNSAPRNALSPHEKVQRSRAREMLDDIDQRHDVE